MAKAVPKIDERNTLAIIAAEAQARRSVAKSANIKTGALPVLALLVFRQQQSQNTRPKTVLAAQICNKSLSRTYLRHLIETKLVALTIRRGLRWLAPTLDGMALASKYARAIRTGSQNIKSQKNLGENFGCA